jgi:hypothetical protein
MRRRGGWDYDEEAEIQRREMLRRKQIAEAQEARRRQQAAEIEEQRRRQAAAAARDPWGWGPSRPGGWYDPFF